MPWLTQSLPFFLFPIYAVVQLTPRLWQLKLNLVNCYLLETEDGLLLSDTGYPDSTDKFFATVWESGVRPGCHSPPTAHHCHIDQSGSAAEMQRRTGARTYALDEPLIASGIAERSGTTRSPGLITCWCRVYLFFIKYVGTSYEPLPVDGDYHYTLLTIPLLARYTFTDPAKPLHIDVRCGGSLVQAALSNGNAFDYLFLTTQLGLQNAFGR